MLLGEGLVLELCAVDGLATSAVACCEVSALPVLSEKLHTVGCLFRMGALTWIMNCLMIRWNEEPL